MLTTKEITQFAVEKGLIKAQLNKKTQWLLSFLGGAYIALGFLACIRVVSNVPSEWGGFSTFLGAAVFPVGLILVILGSVELLTGNMMLLPLAHFAKKITFWQVLQNWLHITLGNLIGALFVAYFFGHIVGLTEGVYLTKVIELTYAKVDQTFLQCFLSGIGCNWLVSLAVWLAIGAKDVAGKILIIWFPIMVFVLIGFQHVVANFFLIGAAIFAGEATWGQFIFNAIPVYLGNAVGGAVFVGLIHFKAFTQNEAS